QANADFDGDGLTNALEFSLPGLDPANADSNGDGIADGDDDLDGDGLSNAEEVAQGTKPGNADSDGDGLSDYDELYLHYSDPNATDTDGDGVPDYVEVVSESDPANPEEALVDPFFVTAISVAPAERTHTLGVDPNPFRLAVKATFEHEGRTL